MTIPKVPLLVLTLAMSAAIPALSQDCPEESSTGPSVASEPRTLEGWIFYHDGIRQWFELKLLQAQCGEGSVELVQLNDHKTPLEVFRDCRVKSTGTIDFAHTGYYSLDVFQSVNKIEPVGACIKQSPFPDYSKLKPDKLISQYQVNMEVDYHPGDHPIVFRISSGGKELQPWQAYASYSLTGGFVLYGLCADGFSVGKVFGTPEAKPSVIDVVAMFDPESAAAAGKWDLQLGYSCVRDPSSAPLR
jgi:hypothetical protein